MPNTQNQNLFGRTFNLPNPNLRSYFALVRNGQPDEYRTPFAKGTSVQSLLAEWDRILKPIRKEWPTLYEFESDLRSKVGPMSVMLPLQDRIPDIDAYYDLILKDQTPISQTAISRVCKEWWRDEPLMIRDQTSTVNLMKKSTSSGSPFFTKRRNVVGKTVPCTIQTYDDKVWQNLPNHSWFSAAVLGWRGQEGGPKKTDVKQRVVWMFPFSVNVCELQVYQPLIEYAQKYNLVPAWVSMEAVDERITQLFDSKHRKDLIVCTDFSKFDQHFGQSCQDAASDILEYLFSRDPHMFDWLNKVFPVKYNIPLAYDWEQIRYGKHGMASGSGGTNADETLVHRALQHEAAINANTTLNPNSMCLGDDGILTYPGITSKDVMRTYTAHGLEMNASKQYESTQDCTFLRRWHHTDYRIDGVCVGVYSTFRALGRLCEQERYYDDWSREMVALRQLSIIENCKYHPLREQFADFCMRRDKYRLGIDIPGFLNNIEAIAEKANEHMPDFLGYTKSMNKDADTGLDNWWIVQYLRSKR